MTLKSSYAKALTEAGALPLGRSIPNGVLGMAMFIAVEGMFFADLASVFLVLRAGSGGTPCAGPAKFVLN